MKMKLTPDGYVFDDNKFCNFGITEAIVVGSMLEAAVGTMAATALVGAGLGAGVGAAMSAITGGNPLTGALTGGLTGGIGGIAGAAGQAAGIGSTAGSTLGGMASGALSAGITGGNPLTQAAMGGAMAFGASALNGGLNSNTSAAPNDPNAPQAPASSADAPSGGRSMSDILSNPTGGSTATAGQTTPYASLTPAQQMQADVVAEGMGGTPGGPASSSPSFMTKASNYLFGPSAPPTSGTVTTMQQAATQAQQSGNFSVFTDAKGNPMGTVGADGTISAVPPGAAGSGAATGSSGGVLSNLGNKIVSNPLQTGLLGMQLYSMAQKPTPPTLAQQQSATQPSSWNSTLPQYQFNSTRAPVADYYKYGYSPQNMQITNTLTPTAPPTTMKTGGKVPRLAGGGIPIPHIAAPRLTNATRRPSGQGLAALGAISRLKSQQGASPTGVAPVSTSLGALSMARGGQTFSRQGQVQMGTGTSGTADKVPAMLSEDEYVVPAAAVSHLGNGSSGAGGKAMDQFVKNILVHGRSKSGGLPPKAKAPEHYLPRGGR